MGMDLLRPFFPSTQGNRWIPAATDNITLYAETKALPAGTGVEISKFFVECIVLRRGAPAFLIIDLVSSVMSELTQ